MCFPPPAALRQLLRTAFRLAAGLVRVVPELPAWLQGDATGSLEAVEVRVGLDVTLCVPEAGTVNGDCRTRIGFPGSAKAPRAEKQYA